jgi:uncharacterized Tic20 family protein/DNA-binding Xre family transcriptional regulator
VHQPELGLKVAALRQQKALSQGELARLCEVTPQTLQRIERGEVEPRVDTLQALGNALDFDFGAEAIENERSWLAVLHLSSIFPELIVTLLIWTSQRRRSRRIDVDGRKALNFQITMALVMFAFGLCAIAGLVAVPVLPPWAKANQELYARLAGWFPLVGIAPMVLIAILCTFEGVINMIRTLSDRPVHYPLSIRFVK